MAGCVYSERDSEDSRIGWIIFDHQARRNAISVEMWDAIPPLVEDLAGDPDVRVVVMRGAGEQAFVAGADISQFGEQRSGDATLSYEERNARAFLSLAGLSKPLLAMIHGFCVGGGVAISLTADMRYASDDATFAIPAARLGLGYQMGGLEMLTRLVGPSRALEIFMTARQFRAQEALEMGLVNAVLPAEKLLLHVRGTAARIADNAPLTISSVKRIVRELGRSAAERDVSAIEASIRACFESEDYREGVSAFLEKRAPRFRGL